MTTLLSEGYPETGLPRQTIGFATTSIRIKCVDTPGLSGMRSASQLRLPAVVVDAIR
ncbi:MAG TPA: hypothetical protein VMW70_03820 [Burkholderiales bacterium]|nr:hypothetical protein [Burkholderiales bacterium]